MKTKRGENINYQEEELKEEHHYTSHRLWNGQGVFGTT